MYIVRTLSSVTATSAIPVESFSTGNAPTGLALEFTGTATASIEGTFDNVYDASVTPVWIALPNWSAITANKLDCTTIPLRAVRLSVTAYTDGNVTMKIYGKAMAS